MNDNAERVTAGLVRLVGSALAERSPSAVITTDRPDWSRRNWSNGRINIFLFETMANPSMQNAESGSSFVDLRYLITFYGKGGLPGTLMGTTIGALGGHPFIDLSVRRHGLLPSSWGGEGTDLRGKQEGQIPERVGLMILPATIQEMASLWSSLRAPCSLSIICQATAVCLD
jgi:hypothetical protein